MVAGSRGTGLVWAHFLWLRSNSALGIWLADLSQGRSDIQHATAAARSVTDVLALCPALTDGALVRQGWGAVRVASRSYSPRPSRSTLTVRFGWRSGLSRPAFLVGERPTGPVKDAVVRR